MASSRKKAKRPNIGRPSLFGAGASYLTVKLSRAQLQKVNRIAAGVPGNKANALRMLLDKGIGAHRW